MLIYNFIKLFFNPNWIAKILLFFQTENIFFLHAVILTIQTRTTTYSSELYKKKNIFVLSLRQGAKRTIMGYTNH